jgi:hypothetical protein
VRLGVGCTQGPDRRTGEDHVARVIEPQDDDPTCLPQNVRSDVPRTSSHRLRGVVLERGDGIGHGRTLATCTRGPEKQCRSEPVASWERCVPDGCRNVSLLRGPRVGSLGAGVKTCSARESPATATELHATFLQYVGSGGGPMMSRA